MLSIYSYFPKSNFKTVNVSEQKNHKATVEKKTEKAEVEGNSVKNTIYFREIKRKFRPCMKEKYWIGIGPNYL